MTQAPAWITMPLVADHRKEGAQECERSLVTVFQLSSPDAIYNQDEGKRDYFSAELMLKSFVGTCQLICA
ncbi:hypothetical protein GQ43DRAFT_283160 [Delitschia confertaspora ATCC 74209]|uniref:Uncharacterized protein n=1 Tax=Delitschia confertaspora ATCC 74209 TaxID=1513339 RepID=A0A9P4JEX2_9PLEO|nr:hypothetical protein GQ43DRAFT_283160 [Delitschia confertaspora ATCC 74209]